MRALFFRIFMGIWMLLKIVEKSRDADIVICAGDLSSAGKNLQRMIDELGRIKGKKVLIIPGNNETPRMINESIDDYENIISVHGEKYQDRNISFFGVGAGTISPFNTVYELSEDEFGKILKNAEKIDCLITHTPPKNTSLDLIPNGTYRERGSIQVDYG